MVSRSNGCYGWASPGIGGATQTCAGSACCIPSRYIDCASNVISSTYKRYVNNSNQKAQTYGWFTEFNKFLLVHRNAHEEQSVILRQVANR